MIFIPISCQALPRDQKSGGYTSNAIGCGKIPTLPNSRIEKMELQYAQQLQRRYYCRKGKRIYVQPNGSAKQLAKCNYTANMYFNLPFMLTDQYFYRHQLSLNDLKTIFTDMPVRYLWMLALYKGSDITTSALQPCYSDSKAITFSGNTIIIKKLMRHFSLQRFQEADRILHPKDEHKPRLPVHLVSKELIKVLYAPLTYYKQHQRYNSILTWADIQVLPVEWYRGYLKLTRVLPKKDYIEQFGEVQDLLHYPQEHVVQHNVYFETEESFFVQTQLDHDALVQGGDPDLAIPITEFKEFKS